MKNNNSLVEIQKKIVSENRKFKKKDICWFKDYLLEQPNTKFTELNNNSIVLKDVSGKQVLFLENKIIKLDKFEVHNASDIILRNCIVDCDLTIQNDIINLERIFIGDCIINGTTNINSAIKNDLRISLIGSNFTKLEIFDLYNSNTSINFCKINNLVLEGCSFEEFETFRNEIGMISVISVDFKKIRFKINQLKNKKIKKVKLLLLSKDCSILDENEIKDVSKQKNLDTQDFILNSTDVKLSKDKYSQAIFKRLLCTNNKLFVWLTGGFMYPGVFLIYTILIIGAWAGIYLLCDFKDMQSLDICESIYFSGVTFFTVGYGDIIPLGGARFLVLIEAFLGVITSSAFLASVIRKFTV